MAGRHPELSPWLAQNHPLGEGYGQACTVLGPVTAGEGAQSTTLAKATRTAAETRTKPAAREGQKTTTSTTDATSKQHRLQQLTHAHS